MTELWSAGHADLKLLVSSGIALTSTDSPLKELITGGTSVTAAIKSLSYKVAEAPIEMQSFFGKDAAGYQNAALFEKPFEIITISGTVALDRDEVMEVFSFGSGSAVTGGYTRYGPGNGNRPTISTLTLLESGSDGVYLGTTNSKVSKLGDIKCDGPDGHFERDFEIVCLPKDYREEFKD